MRGRLVSVVLLVAIGGCCEAVPPKDRVEAIRRVNDNLKQIDAPLSCAGLTSIKLRDEGGHTRRFIGHDARLIFAAPRNLLFDVQSLTGVVAEMGSNKGEYWIWVDPEIHKLWWGSWAQRDAGTARPTAIPPQDLIDALLLRPLPEPADEGQAAMLQQRGLSYWLVYPRFDARGDAVGTRELKLDRCAPYQVRELIDFTPDRRVALRAVLKTYRAVGGSGPLIPHHYEFYWPEDGAELRFDVGRARFRPDLPGEVFDTPTRWNGEIECLDVPERPLPGSARGAAD